MRFFNLEEYLKNPSQKVVTRDGREVRIICTDMKSYDDDKIVTLIKKMMVKRLYYVIENPAEINIPPTLIYSSLPSRKKDG